MRPSAFKTSLLRCRAYIDSYVKLGAALKTP